MKIGILGGGQLGLMLAESLEDLGAEYRLFDPSPEAPCATRLPQHTTTANWDDLEALERFFEGCDVITYESENVMTAPFYALDVSDRVLPSIPVLEVVQDRIREKTFLERAKLPHVAFRSLKDLTDLPALAASFGYPFILKSARGGYDGKGQYRVQGPDDLAHLPPFQEGIAGWWVIEEVVDIAMEVSCIVAIGTDGEEQLFPLFDNQHRNHILDFSTTPAILPEEVSSAIREVALEAARTLGVTGLLTVEFFLTRDPGRTRSMRQVGDWVFGINEFAPRPHNSGHVTRQACTFSQFDALARILTGQPITTPRLREPHRYCMGQLLGEVWEAQNSTGELNRSALAEHPEVVEFFPYGKTSIRTARKMGHYISQSSTTQAALHQAKLFRERLMRGEDS